MSRQDEIKELIRVHYRRLQGLKMQKAEYGISADPKISIEIEDIEADLKQLQAELESLIEDHPDDSSLTTTKPLPIESGPLGDRMFTHFNEINRMAEHLRRQHYERQVNILPMQVLIPELDMLFDSLPFRFEALRECTEQAWDRRLHYAYQVLAVLQAYQRNVGEEGSREQYQLYRQLLEEVSGYAMNMGVCLFEAKVIRGNVEKYVGTDDFYAHLPPKLPPFPLGPKGLLQIPEDIDLLCEGKRKAAVKVMDKLRGTVK
jgi:hypothetical protein